MKKAEQSKEVTTRKQIEEEITLAYYSAKIDEIANQKTIEEVAQNIKNELQKNDSSANAIVNDNNIKVTYKGEKMTIRTDNSQEPVTNTKLTLNQVIDMQRSPATPIVGQNITVWNFTTPYRYNGQQVSSLPEGNYLKFTNLGTINSLSDDGLKENLKNIYPNKNYDVVRLDEYNSNDEFQGNFSQGGILYLVNKENGVYLFIASRYASSNSYGYLICLDEQVANWIHTQEQATSIVQEVVDDIN